MDLQSLTDEELCKLSKEGNEEAESILLYKYKAVVKNRAKTLFLTGGDMDDLIQEGMIGLFMAMKGYDENKGTSFSAFARLALERRMYNAIKAQNTKKNSPLNNYVSLDSSEREGEEGGQSIALLRAGMEAEPEKKWIDRENTDFLMMRLSEELSEFEKEVLKLSLSGKDYKEIGKELKKSPKSIDNALQRIKKKLKGILSVLS